MPTSLATALPSGHRHGSPTKTSVANAVTAPTPGCVISNAARGRSSATCLTRLTRFFSVILTSGEYGIAKPDPRIFQEACRRAAVAATDAVYVGDDWSLDIVGSLGAGLQPIWVRRGATGPRDIPAQIRVVTDLSALPATLASSRGI